MVTKIPARIIATTGVTAGSYTSADITVNESGQITSASNGAINTGPQGLAGAQGTQGVQGTTGTNGTIGVNGAQGTQGVQGTTGTNGTIGVNGAQGTQGVQGTTGTTGATGSQGTTGATGAAGSGTITDDTSTASTYYPVFATATTGTLNARVSSSKATWNPSTGLLTVSKLTSNNTITGPAPSVQSAITGVVAGNSAFVASNTNVGTTVGYVPAFGQTSTYTSGYLSHMVLGSYRTANGWGGGPFIAWGGNDGWATEAWIFNTGGSITHTGGATFLNSGNYTSYKNYSDIYASNWFRSQGDTGLYFQDKGYGLWSAGSAGASYGNASTYGTGVGSWQGWNITNDFTWMGRDNTDCGLYDSSSGHWIIYSLYNTSYMALNTSTTSASYNVYVNGSLYATSNVTAYSDRRKKKDIITIDSALAKVNGLRGVYYTRIDNPIKHHQDRREMGVIAQEVELVTPEVVTYASDVDEYGVSYGNFAGLFIEAIKELTTKVNNLAEELKVLKDKYNDN